ncbi:hypothetical protein A4X06_0g4825 [Tilletia controversa]|uniref:SUN domain-containing protein n=2 Tax=Tilletia TaxID=13289 RepID=A0A8X7MT30_9BASI|nr:hypothetical protein CF336_g4572 [Tilletia laevis]KAE8195629.1 hypothetical protein CF328_g4376 [Tilletia controversa]KAE8200966.1 hypothetical protein CF335_g3840 [Tilletia laevis]KAE8246916.1 hypothetical protein A4X06_0g4825 [Tilletia controversa]
MARSTSSSSSPAAPTSARFGTAAATKAASTSRGPRKSQLSQRAAAANASADASNEDASASATGARAVSSFFLSQAPRSRGGRRSREGSSGQPDEDQEEAPVRQAGRQRTSQRRQADLSVLTNASDEDDDGQQGGRSFTGEAAYASRLDASARHIGQLLSKNGRNATGARRNGKQRQTDEDEDTQSEGNGNGDEEEEDGETSDPDAANRKHGHLSTPNGASSSNRSASNKASSSRVTLDTSSRQKEVPPAVRGPDRAHPAASSGLLSSMRNFGLSTLSSVRKHPMHVMQVVLTILLLSYLHLRTSGLESPQGSDAASALSRTTSKLSQRLTNVESHISKLGKVQGQHSNTLESLSTRVSTLELSKSETEEHVRRWKKELKGRTREEAELSRWKKEVETALKDQHTLLNKQVGKVREELAVKIQTIAADAQNVTLAASASAATTSATREAQAEVKKYNAELQRLADRLDEVNCELGKTQDELASLDKRSTAAQTRAEAAMRAITEDPTSWLNDYLPSLVPVRWDRSSTSKGNSKGAAEPELRIDEAFWEDLRTHFVSHAEALTMVEAHKAAMALETPAPPTERDLRAIASREAKRALDGGIADGVLLGKSAFKVLLEKELRLASTALELKINATQTGLEREKLERQDAVEDMRALAETVRSAGGDRASRWSFSWGGAGSGSGAASESEGATEAEAGDDDDSRARVIELIDQALELYSLDKLGRPDYALYSSGARVLPALTSRSHGHPGEQVRVAAPKFWSWPVGKEAGSLRDAELVKGRGRPPVTALHPDISPGMCWAFSGSRGTLGIKLARKNVQVSHVTIEHAPERLVTEAAHGSRALSLSSSSPIRSAPRRIQVWGRVVGGSVEWARAQAFSARRAAEESRTRLLKGGLGGEERESMKPEGAKTGRWIRLGEFEYEAGQSELGSSGKKWSPRRQSHIQTFAVDTAVAALKIGVDAVQVGVLSNHGNERYTCLYRVRIHGEPEDDDLGADGTNDGEDVGAIGLDSLV